MKRIKIACTSGITLPLEKIDIYPSNLKKHSQLEIERLVDSIANDGFLFPLAVGKLNGKNYVIDGECTYYALQELKFRDYEIPEIPVFYIRTISKDMLKKNILAGTSTNHCVTKNSIKDFVAKDNIDLKQFSFNEGERIDFYTVLDIERYFEIAKSNKEKGLTGKEDYFSLLKDGEI